MFSKYSSMADGMAQCTRNSGDEEDVEVGRVGGKGHRGDEWSSCSSLQGKRLSKIGKRIIHREAS
jgi:hypothetical protein